MAADRVVCVAAVLCCAQEYDPEQLGLALSYCFLIPYFSAWIAQVSRLAAGCNYLIAVVTRL